MDILPQRKSPRLKGYDYANSGAYFVTLCSRERECLFGDVVDGDMHLNRIGNIATACWMNTSAHFPQVEIDAFVIMPNHVHGIIILVDAPKQPSQENTDHSNIPVPISGSKERTRRASSLQTSALSSPPSARAHGTDPGSLGTMIGSYKSAVTKEVNRMMGITAPLIWQSSFHDHIIRSEPDLNRIREYIAANPVRWLEDSLFIAHE